MKIAQVLFFVLFTPAILFATQPDISFAQTATESLTPSPTETRSSTLDKIGDFIKSHGESGTCVTRVGNPGPEVTPPGPLGCNKGTSGGSGGSSGGPAGPCQQAPPVPSNIQSAIQQKWGINVNLPDNQMPYVWEEFYKIDCTGILQDLRGMEIQSWNAGWAEQFSCPGTSGAHGTTDIMFHNGWVGTFMEAILTHEMTHVWQFCSDRGEANLLEVENAYNAEGGLTKYSRRECPDFVPPLTRIYHEDHADTIALFLNPDSGELTCGNGAPNPFAGGGKPAHKTAAQRGASRGVGPQGLDK